MGIAITLHLLATIAWIGGMLFAHFALRPAAATLEAPARLALWAQVFRRFFAWVWAAILVLFVTGLWMVLVPFQGFANVKLHVHAMLAIAVVMAVIFAWLFFVPYRRLRTALAAGETQVAAAALGRIRLAVSANLALGLLTTMVATGGAYWF
jgi:uncharacterized membrane protein